MRTDARGEVTLADPCENLAILDLSSAMTLQWIPDGDHGFEPRRSSGRTEEQNLAGAVGAIATFLG
jgi:predicted alpha/beta-hydrolase family hydrolase